MRSCDEREHLADIASRNLYEFTKAAWPIVEPGVPFVENWHVGAICEHLQAVSEGQIKRLLINIPPGHMKSLTTAVMWPAWHWIRRPSWRAWFASYTDDIVLRDASKRRDIIQSDFYKDTFKPNWKLTKQNALDKYVNSQTGFHMTTTIHSSGTGLRADCVVVDDPINIKDVYSKVLRQKVLYWWDKVMHSRLSDPRTGSKVIMMQRSHEEDLAGHVIKEAQGYEHLMLPTEFEPTRRTFTSIGWTDPRKEAGELLFPQMYTPEVLVETKKILGSDGFAGQHQQRPTSAEGSMFKRAWFTRRWRHPGAAAIPGVDTKVIDPAKTKFDEWVMTVDASFKDTEASDKVAVEVWARLGPDKFLIDMRWDRMGLMDTIRAILDLYAKYPRCIAKLVEDKANGSAIIEVLKTKVPGIIPVTPGSANKESRAAAISPECEAGNVWLPQDAPWVGDLIEEIVSFPKGANDDGLDAMCYAVERLTVNSSVKRFHDMTNM